MTPEANDHAKRELGGILARVHAEVEALLA